MPPIKGLTDRQGDGRTPLKGITWEQARQRGGNVPTNEDTAPDLSGAVLLASENPRLTVRGKLIEAASSWPRPKFEQLDRYGFYDLPKYSGQEPFAVDLTMRIGDGEESLEGERGQIRSLEKMAERPEGRDAPPEVRVDGPVPHRTLRWYVTGIVEDLSRAKWVKKERVFIVVTVSLSQRVTDTAAVASVTAAAGKGRGIGQGKYTVKKDGMDLYDVAQDFYRNSTFALAISKANSVDGENPMPLGTVFRAGDKLKMP